MLIDAVTYFGEKEVLEIRLDYLNDIVDYFVIVEAGKTQSLLDKPFNFEKHRHKFKKYLDKIIYVKVEDYPDSRGWAMENHQRNCILRGLNQFNGESLLMISDVDEIPDKEVLRKNMVLAALHLSSFSFAHIYCAYYLNLACMQKSWRGTILTNIYDARTQSPQGLRNIKDTLPPLRGGFHFSWLGGWEKAKEKYLSCIEPFNKNLDFVELEKYYHMYARDNGFFLHSDNPYDLSVPLKKIDLSLLPPSVLKHKRKYKNLLLP